METRKRRQRKPVISLDPEGAEAYDLRMDESETTAWIRIGDSELVVRLYRPKKEAEDQTGRVYPDFPVLGIEIFPDRRAIKAHEASHVLAIRAGDLVH